MKQDRVNAQMDELFSAALRACEQGTSTSDFEQSFERLLEFILDYPECRPSAEQRFIAHLADGSMGWELAGYCMHTLRMPAVKEEALRLLALTHDSRLNNTLARVLASFEDDWDDAVLYRRYSSLRSPPEP